MLVPAMVYFLRFGQHVAQGTSLLAIIPTAFVAATVYGVTGHIDLNTGAWIAAAGMVGGFFGSSFANKMDEGTLKLVYAFFMLLIGIKMITG